MFPNVSSHNNQTNIVVQPFPMESNIPEVQAILLAQKETQSLMEFKEDVYLSPFRGVTVVLLWNDDSQALAKLIMDTEIMIPAGQRFNALPFSEASLIHLWTANQVPPRIYPLKQAITLTSEDAMPQISRILSIHTYQYEQWTKDFLQQLINYRLLINHSGTLELVLDDQLKVLKANQACVIQPDQTVQIVSNHQSTYSEIEFEANYWPLGIMGAIVDIPLAMSHQLLNRTQDLPLALLAWMYQLIHDSMYPLEFSDDVTITANEELLKQILTYIEANIEKKQEVSDLVEEFQISRSTLQNLFQEHLQTTPLQYMNRIRLEKSQTLIRETQLSISEIAKQLGFGSLQYFSRSFSQYFDESPSAYLKRVR